MQWFHFSYLTLKYFSFFNKNNISFYFNDLVISLFAATIRAIVKPSAGTV